MWPALFSLMLARLAQTNLVFFAVQPMVFGVASAASGTTIQGVTQPSSELTLVPSLCASLSVDITARCVPAPPVIATCATRG